ncbi:GNAT family N-acetyltransferase [Pontibacter cellulosilyticus]|uniref:GNAT family N-acetyltransferase n=1 Tax=Pontibacter cellulosilyticus TaxID=1720253 RepID=A0A923SK81_9BACT|nr:GNAT family N-acetyltransferase [Pontibacter cellulosilyticus]MBC5994659.1 GNAT family N-acetyltransferase [Pontibacter cellulosilyticus]
MIKSIKYSDLSPSETERLQHHIDTEFGHVPFVQAHVWAQPDWSIIKYEEDNTATFYNVVLREIALDGQNVKAAGINNVITPEAYRGKGYATTLLKATEGKLFDEWGCDCGVLLCADALVPFYSRLNWYKVDAILYYDQPAGKQLYDSNVMLLTPPGCSRLSPKEIDLNGLPW